MVYLIPKHLQNLLTLINFECARLAYSFLLKNSFLLSSSLGLYVSALLKGSAQLHLLCWLSLRSRAVTSRFGLSRLSLKFLMSRGLISGMRKIGD